MQKIYRKLYRFLSVHQGKKLDDQLIEHLLQPLSRLLFLPPSSLNALKLTLMLFSPEILTGSRISDLSFLFAYGHKDLISGVQLHTYNFTPGEYKFQCEKVSIITKGKGQIIPQLKFLDGLLYDRVVSWPLSSSMYLWLAKSIGMTGRKREAAHPRELIGSRMNLYIYLQDGRMKISKSRETDPNKPHNYRLKKLRKQHESFLPRPCHYCEKTPKECRFSTHLGSWVWGDCKEGHRAYFEEDQCLQCLDEWLKNFLGVSDFEEDK